MVTVHNLATGSKQEYSCSPEEAVLAAHAQAHGNWNTWEYRQKYGSLLIYGQHTVCCGDWAATKDSQS